MTKKIIVLTGSPRINGNTDLLVESFIDGAKENGNEVFRFDTARMSINGCIDCKYCFKHEGKCRQDDDMQKIYEALRLCDILVLASPVYWFDFSAQIKAAIDRMYAHIGQPYPIKKCALLLVCADTDSSVADGAVTTYKAMANYLKWQDIGIILECGVTDKGEIIGKNSFVKAKALGKSI